jgi:phospholipid transport system substrate-binding protein
MKEPMSSRLVQRIAGAWLGLGLAGLTLLCSAEATAASALDTVQSFYDTLLIIMRRGNELGQSGRFIQLQPVVHSIFDVPFMARMAIGSGWATVSSAQQQQVIEAFERYIAAIYADRFDTYSGEQFQVLGEQRSAAGTVVMKRIADSNGEPQKFELSNAIQRRHVADRRRILERHDQRVGDTSLRVCVYSPKAGHRWTDCRAEPKGGPALSTAIGDSEPR